MKHYLIIALALILLSCNRKQEKTSPVIEDISESVYASGIVKSKDQYQVFSKVNGIIQEVYLKEGDTVKIGTPIIRILNETSKLNTENARLAAELAGSNANKINELKANIDILKSKLQNDSLLYARQKSLWAQQIGSLVELEQRELQYKNSKTNLDIALLRYSDTQKQLNVNAKQSENSFRISNAMEDDFIIKSETKGILYSLLKEKGEMVSSLNPFAVIGSASEYVLELQVDENDITKVKKGQKILVVMNSYKNQVFEAKVEKVNTIMNEKSRSFTVDASFVIPPPSLFPNLSVEANIIIQTRAKALIIPRSYLIENNYVLNEDKEKIKIEVGLKDYQKVEVLSGLTEKDVIVKIKK